MLAKIRSIRLARAHAGADAGVHARVYAHRRGAGANARATLATRNPKCMSKRPLTPTITTRDLQLLLGLLQVRILTLAQITGLYFAGAAEAAKKRVQILKSARLIAQRPRPRPYDRSILFLAKRGFELLRDGGHLSGYPKLPWKQMAKRVRVSPLTLAHELSVNQIKIAFSNAVAKQNGLTLEVFFTWPKLFAFEVQTSGWNGTTTIRPDGYVEIRDRRGEADCSHFAYLEVDRSTESLSCLTDKAADYLQHYRRGGFARSQGRSAEQYKSLPFRVLVVLNNDERRNNLAAALLKVNPPILSLTWLTTLDRILADPLGKIWMRPCDYRDAMKDSDVDEQPRRPYRRQPKRERQVAETVKLQSLFGKIE